MFLFDPCEEHLDIYVIKCAYPPLWPFMCQKLGFIKKKKAFNINLHLDIYEPVSFQ